MNIWIIIGLVGFILKYQNGNTIIEEPPGFIDPPNNNNNTIIVTDDVDAHCTIRYQEFAGTEHFSLNEFNSNDGTLVPSSIRGNIQLLMEQLEIVRDYIQLEFQQEMQVIITSGYRSPAHNMNVGGVSNSYHLCGMAADFYVPGLPHSDVQDILNYLMISGEIINGGLGRYDSFTHYDIGSTRRWNG